MFDTGKHVVQAGQSVQGRRELWGMFVGVQLCYIRQGGTAGFDIAPIHAHMGSALLHAPLVVGPA